MFLSVLTNRRGGNILAGEAAQTHRKGFRLQAYRSFPRAYELMVLISPALADDDLVAQVDRVRTYITATGGEITFLKQDTPWGRRRLAYPISGFRDATYVLYHFNSVPTQITEIERDLKLDERVLRYLLVKLENEPTAAESESGDEGVEPTQEVDAQSEAAGPEESNEASDGEAAEPGDDQADES